MEFLHDVLDAGTAHANAGAHGIDVAFTGEHGDFGSAARIAGDAHDLHGAVVDFRHFAAEEGGGVVAVRTRNDDLRAAAFFLDLDDQGLHAIAALVMLAGDLLFLGKDGFGPAEVDDPAALVAALNDAAADFAHAVLELFIDEFLFGVAHTLDDHLLGGLGRDAPEVGHLEGEADFVVELHGRIEFAGLFDVDFGIGIGHVVNDDLELVDLDFPGVVVVADFDVDVLAVFADNGSADGVLKRIHEHVAIEPFVFADLVDGLFQFQIHAAPPRVPLESLESFLPPSFLPGSGKWWTRVALRTKGQAMVTSSGSSAFRLVSGRLSVNSSSATAARTPENFLRPGQVSSGAASTTSSSRPT